MTVWEAVAVVGWAVLLLNLALTLRVVRSLRGEREGRLADAERGERSELPLGEPAPPFRVRDLAGGHVGSEDYLGTQTALLFVSPHCGPCRREMPALMNLAGRAQQSAGAQFVLVSDSDAAETRAWISSMQQDDGLELTVPVLLAAGLTSDLQMRYNPHAVSPYFCLLDAEGVVTARGVVNSAPWVDAVRVWDSAARRARRFR